MASDPLGEYNIDGMTPAVVALLKKVAEESSKRTMVDSFLMIGIDITDPIKAQDAFAALRRLTKTLDDEDAIADRLWVRKSRKRSEGIFGKAWAVVVTAAIMNGLYLAWLGLKTALKLP